MSTALSVPAAKAATNRTSAPTRRADGAIVFLLATLGLVCAARSLQMMTEIPVEAAVATSRADTPTVDSSMLARTSPSSTP